MDDYQRGVADERARIRKHVSKQTAYFAEQAGVSVDAVESWDGLEDGVEITGKDKEARKKWVLIAYALSGVLEFIDSNDHVKD